MHARRAPHSRQLPPHGVQVHVLQDWNPDSRPGDRKCVPATLHGLVRQLAVVGEEDGPDEGLQLGPVPQRQVPHQAQVLAVGPGGEQRQQGRSTPVDDGRSQGLDRRPPGGGAVPPAEAAGDGDELQLGEGGGGLGVEGVRDTLKEEDGGCGERGTVVEQQVEAGAAEGQQEERSPVLPACAAHSSSSCSPSPSTTATTATAAISPGAATAARAHATPDD